MKKERAIAIFVNSDYVFALGTLIINLKQINTKYDNLIAYSYDLTEEDKKFIMDLEPRCKFINYTYDDFVKEFNIKKLSNLSQSFIKRYSHLSYIKLKILELLDSFKCVLLVDLDVLIMDSIDELFDLKCNIAWRNGNTFKQKFCPADVRMNKKFNEIKEFKEINDITPTPNGGLVIVNDNFNYQKAYTDGKFFLAAYIDFFSAGIDELTFGFLCHKNNLNLLSLNSNIYNSFPQFYTNESKIIHFFGASLKPWTNPFIQALFPEWMNNYKIFIDKTGKTYPDVQIFNNLGGDVVKPFIIRELWENFLKNANFKIPKSLHLRYDFTKEWLIFDYNSFIYYEIKLFLYEPNQYIVGMWLKGDFILTNEHLNQTIQSLINNNKNFFQIQKDTRGIYIYSKKQSIEKIFSCFEYLYSITSQIRKLLI